MEPAPACHVDNHFRAAARLLRMLSLRGLSAPGDLNYRVSMDGEAVREHASRRDLAPLLEADQLRAAQRSGAAFSEYREGAIAFLPTYKYDMGSAEYDTSEKRRIPAWCDRWRVEPTPETCHVDTQFAGVCRPSLRGRFAPGATACSGGHRRTSSACRTAAPSADTRTIVRYMRCCASAWRSTIWRARWRCR